MLFYVLCTAFYLGISIATMIDCNTPQSQYTALCAYSDNTTLIVAIMDVITTCHVLGLPIWVMMCLNVEHGKRVGLIVVFSDISVLIPVGSLAI